MRGDVVDGDAHGTIWARRIVKSDFFGRLIMLDIAGCAAHFDCGGAAIAQNILPCQIARVSVLLGQDIGGQLFHFGRQAHGIAIIIKVSLLRQTRHIPIAACRDPRARGVHDVDKCVLSGPILNPRNSEGQRRVAQPLQRRRPSHTWPTERRPEHQI